MADDVGTSTTYDIRYATSPIAAANWEAATQATGEPEPQPARSPQSFVVTGLAPGTTYHFALKTADEVPSWSGLSNVVSGATAPVNRAPNEPTLLFQLRSDWVTEIPVGGETAESTVVFKGTLTDPESDRAKLQIELRRLDEYGGQFDETKGGLKESEFVASGSEAVAIAEGLLEGEYHWRARTVDERGKASQWADFGGNDTPDMDFRVLPNQPPVADFNYSPERPKAGQWITFDASTSRDPDGQVDFYAWDLNNDQVYDEYSPSPIVRAQWNRADIYTVGLRVTDTSGANTWTTKSITVRSSFWDKVGSFFKSLWPWGDDIKEIEDGDLSKLKEELDLDDWLPGTRFWWYTNYDLKEVLNKEMEPEKAPGLTYGVYILNAMEQTDMMQRVLSQRYKLAASAFFEAFLDLNTGWSSLAGDLAKKFLTGLMREPYGTAASSLLLSIDVAKGAVEAKALGQTLLYNTLWSYFENRKDGMTHEEAWRYAASGAWSQNWFRENDRIKEYFGNLHNSYEGFLSAAPPYVDDVAIKDRLRDLLLSAFEQYAPGLPDRRIVVPKSPVEVRVYDVQGRATGVVSGEVVEQIPDSACDGDTQMIMIFSLLDSLRYEVVGSSRGSYGLSVTSLSAGLETTFAATGIPTSAGAVHQYTVDWDALSQGEEGVTVQIDSEGDGVFEQTIVADATLEPPVAEAAGPYEGSEGSTIILDASGSHDTDGSVVVFEWDFDGDGEYDASSSSATTTFSWGDDYVNTVTLRVTDDEGLSSTTVTQVAISNLSPSLRLDTLGVVLLAGGDAFLGWKGVGQAHQASGRDPGSDDLTFHWSFGYTSTYFNDGAGPDPFPSPRGIYPFEATDTASVTFDAPGVYVISVDVTDDDGGTASDSLPKLVTGDCKCAKTIGFWGHQFRAKGRQHIDNATLEAYLAIVDFASGVFSEQVPASTLEEAEQVFRPGGDDDDDDDDKLDMWAKAVQQALAAWLNFASGAVAWDETMTIRGDDDAGRSLTMAFQDAMPAVESILLDPNATHSDLAWANTIATSINEIDEENETCDDDNGDDEDDDRND